MIEINNLLLDILKGTIQTLVFIGLVSFPFVLASKILFPMFPKEKKALNLDKIIINSECRRCRNYHGRVYGENLLVCAIHPYGQENCADYE